MGDKNKKTSTDAWSDNDLPVVSNPNASASQSSWDDNDLPLIEDAQKKSPVGSAYGLANSSQGGQPGYSQAAPIEKVDWNTPSATIDMPEVRGITVNNSGKPMAQALPAQQPASVPKKVRPAAHDATSHIAQDFVDNMDNLAPQYKSADDLHYSDVNNPINKITNPHGDPEYTAGYITSRLAQARQEYEQARKDMQARALHGELPTQEQQEAFGNFTRQMGELNKLKTSAGEIVALQLFNKDYSTKHHDESTANTAIQALRNQREAAISDIDKKIQGTYKYEHPDGTYAQKERNQLERQKAEIAKHYNQQQAEVWNQTKYNPINLGAEYAALMGDAKAKEDVEKLRQGKSIDPAAQYKYNQRGDEIIKSGTAAATNEKAKEEGTKHLDVSGERLFNNNKDYLINQARQKIGNKRYKDESALLHAIVPSVFLPNISKAEIKKYAEEEGLDERTTQELLKEPGEIPKSASFLQQMGKSMLNTAAPIYEQGIRNAVRIVGGDEEAVNERFQPGWEDNAGIGSVIAGNMPTEQNSFRNIRGAVGQILGGAAGLSTFAGEVGIAEKGLAALGMTAGKAEKLANFGVMAFSGYNNAYHESKEIIGDKPEDESKRQLYSMVRGLAEGSIFSIHPPSNLVKNALGDMEKSGEQFLNELKSKPVAEVLRNKPAIADYVVNMAKDLGVQVTLAEGNQIATNIINTISDNKKHDLDEGVVETGISTALSMAIPSVMSGFQHTHMQTPLNKAAIFEVGSHPEQYVDHIMQMRNEGKLTDAEANKLYQDIQTINKTVQVTPTHNTDGEPLTPDQIKDYAFNLLQEGVLTKRVDEINKKAESAGVIPDKAQTSPLEKGISELTKQREEIMKTAGQGRPVETPVEQEAEENIPEETKENNIPLSSDNSSSKKEENESITSIKDNEGRQDGPEIERSEEDGSEPELRSAADSEGRSQQEEDRVLSSEKGNEKEAAQTEQPSVVRQRSKRKYASDKEVVSDLGQEPSKEPIEIPAEEPSQTDAAVPEKAEEKPIEEPAVQEIVATKASEDPLPAPKESIPVSELNQETDASPQAQAQQREGLQPSGEQEPARVEPAGSEEASASAESSNSAERGEAKEITLPEGFTTRKTNETRKDGKKIFTKTEGDTTHTVTVKKDGTAVVESVDKSSGIGVGEHSKTYAADIQDFDSLESAIKHVNEYGKEVQAEAPVEDTHTTRIKEIDEDLLRQRASQKLEADKRNKADKANNIEAFNKANENWYKKQERIDKLEAEKSKMIADRRLKEREVQIKESYSAAADKISSMYERNKKRHKGIATASFTGLSHKIADHVMDFLVARVVDGVKELGNIHVAIDRAIRMAKEKYGDEAKKISQEDALKIKEHIGYEMPPQDSEPVLSLQDEEVAKLDIADIEAGVPYIEVVNDILNDEGLTDKKKSKILNYIDWHVQDRDYHNSQTLRGKKYDGKYLTGYELKNSDQISPYLSGHTLKDVHDQDVQFAVNSKETQLLKGLVEDTANMVGLAKSHSGSDDVLVYGTEMLGHIKSMPDGPDGLTVKKLLAVSGLNNELHGERMRLEEEAIKAKPERKNEISNRLNQINKMIAQAEIMYRDITSNASNVLNAARANRIFRNTYFAEEFANKILSEQQLSAKEDIEGAMSNTTIPDKIVEQGATVDARKAEKDIEDIIEQKSKSEAGQNVESDITSQKETTKPKSKGKSQGVVDKLRERIRKKKKEGDAREEVIDKKTAEKKANDYLAGATLEDLFKKAKEQTKKPC